MRILLFALVLFCTKANAQVMPFGMLHSNEAANAPTITDVAAGDGQVAVTFVAPLDDGGADITIYTATSNPENKKGTLNQAGSGTITVPGLTNGKAYTFTVTATNSAGQSATSAASNAVTPIPILAENEVYNPATNRIWMDHNLGASRAAESSTDAESYGDLYQWGRGEDGHQIRESASLRGSSNLLTPTGGNFFIGSSTWYYGRYPDNLWQGVNGVNNPCPLGYRIPTIVEWDAERVSWDSQDAEGAFASPLKLPVAGWRGSSSGLLTDVDYLGYYKSSTFRSNSNSESLYFFSSSSERFIGFKSSAGRIIGERAGGQSVRCIKN